MDDPPLALPHRVVGRHPASPAQGRTARLGQDLLVRGVVPTGNLYRVRRRIMVGGRPGCPTAYPFRADHRISVRN